MCGSPGQLFVFEQVARPVGAAYGDQFDACRRLLTMIEAVAPDLDTADRTHLARLLTSTGHSILLTCGKRI